MYFFKINRFHKRKEFCIFKNSNNNMLIGYIKFRAGDILQILFWVRGALFTFEGMCISLMKKNIKNNNASITLRNVLVNVGIELKISYFVNRLFFFKVSDYKKKKFIYKKSKLYFVRNRVNT
jgi:ribosomal protein L19